MQHAVRPALLLGVCLVHVTRVAEAPTVGLGIRAAILEGVDMVDLVERPGDPTRRADTAQRVALAYAVNARHERTPTHALVVGVDVRPNVTAGRGYSWLRHPYRRALGSVGQVLGPCVRWR